MDESNARAAVIEKVEGWLDLFDDDMKPKSTDTPIPPQVLELLAKFEEDRSSSTTTTSSTSSTSSYPFSLDDTLFQFPSNSGSEEADVWFRRGIAWAHGFNFEEGSRCFQQALNIQDFSLGHWGLALCQGPYYNRHGARYVKEGQRRDAPTFNIMRALEHAMEAERRLSTLPSDSIQSKLVRAMCVRCRSFATTLVVEEEEEEEKEKEKEVGKSHRGGRCCSAAWPTFADAAALVGGLTVALGRRRTATQPSSGPSWLGHPHAQRDNCCGCCCPPIFGRNGNGVVIVFRRLHDPIVSILVLFNGVRAADRHLAVLALPEPAGTASHGSAKEIQEGTGGGGEGSPFSLVG